MKNEFNLPWCATLQSECLVSTGNTGGLAGAASQLGVEFDCLFGQGSMSAEKGLTRRDDKRLKYKCWWSNRGSITKLTVL